jgi:hypothetical protein
LVLMLICFFLIWLISFSLSYIMFITMDSYNVLGLWKIYFSLNIFICWRKTQLLFQSESQIAYEWPNMSIFGHMSIFGYSYTTAQEDGVKLPWITCSTVEEVTWTFVVTAQNNVINQWIYQRCWWEYQVGGL